MTPEGLERAAELIAGANRLLVSTGAGMSRESGIPTFRDAREGLWSRYDPAELASPEGFAADPARVWTWYEHRRRMMSRCRPHAGHQALVELEEAIPRFTLVTQNIDGLHQEAGSREVVELHGNIHRFKCFAAEHGADPPPLALSEADEEARHEPPGCPRCGSPLRPDVVWFGEPLPERAVRRAWEEAPKCDVLLLVGTSGTVWPAAELPLLVARSGGRVVEVNPRASELTRVADVFLDGPAGRVLPELVARAGELRGNR